MPLCSPAQYAHQHRLRYEAVLLYVHRGQLQYVPGTKLLRLEDRPHKAGPRLVTRHGLGGVLCWAGGPGKLRRVTLKEREAHRRALGSECGCELCVTLAEHEREQELERSKERAKIVAEDLEEP